MPPVVIAAAYDGPEVLTLVDQPTPEPGPGHARITIMAAGVNPIDYKMYSGTFNRDPAALPMRLGAGGRRNRDPRRARRRRPGRPGPRGG
jgi:NADPH2:quinone reductase